MASAPIILTYLVGLQQFKTETLITVLDKASRQMSSRFEQQNWTFMSQLALFAPNSLMSDRCFNSSDIDSICTQYSVDSGDIASDLFDFRRTFKLLCNQDGDLSLATEVHSVLDEYKRNHDDSQTKSYGQCRLSV